MTNNYFDPSTVVVQNQTPAVASDVNAVSVAVSEGFDLLPDPLEIETNTTGFGIDSGLPDAYIITTSQNYTAYTIGMKVSFIATNANLGASTVKVDTAPTVDITFIDGSALNADTIFLDGEVYMTFDGSGFQYRPKDSGTSAIAAAQSATDSKDSADDAAANAANVNLPVIQTGDVGKILEVDQAETGYDLVPLSLGIPEWIDGAKFGTELNVPGIGSTAMTAITNTDIVLADTTAQNLRAFRFNYDTQIWAALGNPFDLGASVGNISITALGTNRVAFFNDAQLRTFDFDGTNWTPVGNILVIPGVGDSALAAQSSTTVAYVDEDNKELRTYGFDGTDWVQIGNGLSISTVFNPALAALNGTDVAFSETGDDDLRTYRFDGTDWVQIGNDLNIPTVGTRLALTGLNGTDIVRADDPSGRLTIFRFDSTDWKEVGVGINIGLSGFTSMATLNGIDIVHIESTTNEDLTTFRFNFAVDEPLSQELAA